VLCSEPMTNANVVQPKFSWRPSVYEERDCIEVNELSGNVRLWQDANDGYASRTNTNMGKDHKTGQRWVLIAAERAANADDGAGEERRLRSASIEHGCAPPRR
jgi:hypothetical protein